MVHIWFSQIKSDNIREIIWSDYSTYQGNLTLCVNTKHINWIIAFHLTNILTSKVSVHLIRIRSDQVCVRHKYLMYVNINNVTQLPCYLIIIHFSDVTLLFEQWIIFKNLQFILLFLNIWTLHFYCFRFKNVINLGLLGIEPLLSFSKSTLTFKTPI
jgi:hypothetical protein